VTGKGNVTLAPGTTSAPAAPSSSGAALNLGAGNNLILAGENRQTLDERHKVTGSSGWLSRTTTRTQDSVSRQTAQGSELNGDSVSLSAGNDLTCAAAAWPAAATWPCWRATICGSTPGMSTTASCT
jgi:filamentous hemagglutinin